MELGSDVRHRGGHVVLRLLARTAGAPQGTQVYLTTTKKENKNCSSPLSSYRGGTARNTHTHTLSLSLSHTHTHTRTKFERQRGVSNNILITPCWA